LGLEQASKVPAALPGAVSRHSNVDPPSPDENVTDGDAPLVMDPIVASGATVSIRTVWLGEDVDTFPAASLAVTV
jgi:hypothetical protein